VVLATLPHIPRTICILLFGTILLEDRCRKKSLKKKDLSFRNILWSYVGSKSTLSVSFDTFWLIYQTFWLIFVMLLSSNIHKFLLDKVKCLLNVIFSIFHSSIDKHYCLSTISYRLIDNALLWSYLRFNKHITSCFVGLSTWSKLHDVELLP